MINKSWNARYIIRNLKGRGLAVGLVLAKMPMGKYRYYVSISLLVYTIEIRFWKW